MVKESNDTIPTEKLENLVDDSSERHLNENEEKGIISIEDMHAHIEKVCDEFVGQGNHLSAAIGVFVMSRLFGWQIMRLISARSDWERTNKIFGDIKKITPKRGKYARKSIGLELADKAGEYWKMIRGEISTIPEKTRRLFNNDYKT